MPRHTARTVQKRKEKFLKAYSLVGTASEAARVTGIARETHKYWLKKSESYRKAFEEADDAATEVLEKEALRRAVEGREEDVYFNGVPVGKVRKYSDVLLIFLMKAKRPDIYRERYDVRTQGNLNIQSAVKVIHEYYPADPAIDGVVKELEPNSRLLTAQVPDADVAPDPTEDE